MREGADSSVDEAAIAAGDAVLKQDGQKADDAAVPVRLWDSMFLLSRATIPEVQHRPVPDGWRRGLDLFRNLLIRVWRRRVFRSWTVWLQRVEVQHARLDIKAWFEVGHSAGGKHSENGRLCFCSSTRL